MVTTPVDKARQIYEKYDKNKGVAVTEVLKLIKNNPSPDYWKMVLAELNKIEE